MREWRTKIALLLILILFDSGLIADKTLRVKLNSKDVTYNIALLSTHRQSEVVDIATRLKFSARNFSIENARL